MSPEASNSESERRAPDAVLLDVPVPDGPAAAPAGGKPRVQRPDRAQIGMRTCSLDALLPEDHRARVVWEFVQGLDLTALYESIRAVEGHVGRAAIDPRILMALWLYATLDGVGSARELDRLCRDHVAYQWICGGVSVNYHTLSDFRTANVELLDELLTQSVAALMAEGLVDMNRVAQDGVRVRASAGSSSFRRAKTLERLEQEAREQVDALRRELEDNPGAATKRQRTARERARRERLERIARARREAEKAQRTKPPKEKDKARSSTTDADVKVLKMADGGFRPAVNVQLASDTGGQIITGVDVTNVGSDKGLLVPMLDQHEQRYERRPPEALADGGFASREDIDAASRAEPPTTVYSPVQKSRKNGQPCYERQPADTDAVAAWRQRMATPEAKAIYKERASTAECVIALARNRGMQQFLVRGLRKIKAVVLWFALAHNLMRATSMRRQLALASA